MFLLDESLGFIIHRLANRLKNALERSFSSHNVAITTEQWTVLARLCEEDGIAQNEIASRTAKDKTNVARILVLMENRGIIERRVSQSDNRVLEIYVTDAGRAVYQKAVSAAREVLTQAQQGFTPAEVEALMSALNKVYDNLE